MKEIAILVAIVVAITLPLITAFVLLLQWRELQKRAHARRLADAKMDARLLRFNI